MGRREIRKLISKATVTMRDLTQCLKPWGWTYSKGSHANEWAKIFTLPYPLRLKYCGQFYVRRKITVKLWFSDHFIGLYIGPYSSKAGCYSYTSYNISSLKLRLKTPLILQKFAVELPKTIASAETEPFYDEAKQEQIKVIPAAKLAAKIEQVFKKIYKTFDAESQ
jgi:hypothetical protein